MTQNDPESTITTFFSQNRPKPAFPVKIDQNHLFRPKSTTTSFFGQNPVFPAKIDKDHFCRPKSTETSFSGQNRPTPLFLAKIDRKKNFGPNQPNPVLFVENPVFSVKSNQNHFFRPKLTKTSFSGQNRPKPVFLAQIDQNQFFWPKSTETSFSSRKVRKTILDTLVTFSPQKTIQSHPHT